MGIALSEAQRLIILATGDGRIEYWDMETAAPLATVWHDPYGIARIEADAAGGRLLIVSASGRVSTMRIDREMRDQMVLGDD